MARPVVDHRRLGVGSLGRRAAPRPHAQTDARELLAAVERSVAADLTPRQRDVFVAICILGVPVDVVAERHGSTRGATYKVLRDARHKLHLALASEGWDIATAGAAS